MKALGPLLGQSQLKTADQILDALDADAYLDRTLRLTLNVVRHPSPSLLRSLWSQAFPACVVRFSLPPGGEPVNTPYDVSFYDTDDDDDNLDHSSSEDDEGEEGGAREEKAMDKIRRFLESRHLPGPLIAQVEPWPEVTGIEVMAANDAVGRLFKEKCEVRYASWSDHVNCSGKRQDEAAVDFECEQREEKVAIVEPMMRDDSDEDDEGEAGDRMDDDSTERITFHTALTRQALHWLPELDGPDVVTRYLASQSP